MKRLVDSAQLDEPQYKELVSLLRQERIPFHETQTHFMDNGAIWVAEEHFSRATDVLRTESAVYGARAKAKWERQWRTEYKSSFVRWFTHKLFRSPVGTVVRLVLLILMLAAFVVYPLWHVARAAI
jgi:hypothetical protein